MFNLTKGSMIYNITDVYMSCKHEDFNIVIKIKQKVGCHYIPLFGTVESFILFTIYYK